MKFASAGHCNKRNCPAYDPGAVGVNGRTEANETVRVRNRVVELIKSAGYHDIRTDLDHESLRTYLERIKPGNASVVVEFHFNAFNGRATGTEVVVGDDADRLDNFFARDLANASGAVLGLIKRSGGVITENQTDRGRLGLMRETGIVALVEICFIDNPSDMIKFDLNFEKLCQAYANVIIKYDNLIN